MSSFPVRVSAADVPEEPDSLSDALIYLAAFHGRVITREALLFGLPVEQGRLSFSLFDRAAGRAGLEVELVRRALGDIPAFVLPAVLVLRDQARILDQDRPAHQTLTVVDPSTREQMQVDAAALESSYLGYAYLVRPAEVSSERARAAGDDRPATLVLGCRSQVLGQLQSGRNRRVYRERACAGARRSSP